MPKSPKVLFFELNEFCPDLLKKAADDFELKNIQKLFKMQRIDTHTDDTYDSDFLEPWVQWVSVHTGTPSSEHQIKHLGDVPHLSSEQIWEKLSQKGVTSGIWGPMNASRGKADNCLFFVPDPWTVTEEAHPKELGAFLDPVRYASQNYLKKSKFKLAAKIWSFFCLYCKNRIGCRIMKEIPRVIKNVWKFGLKNFVFIAVADYLSTLLFLRYKKKYNPDFTLLFLNSLAHIQHHHWIGFDYKKNEKIKYGLEYIDRILAKVYDSMEAGDQIIVTNALSQKNTNDETPWVLYRQHDQAEFLKKIGIAFERVESLMTHDAHIHFTSQEDAEQAKGILELIEVEGKKLFLLEDYKDDPKKLFYRLQFTDKIEKDTIFKVGDKTFRFLDLFEAIVTRSGKHIPEGQVFTTVVDAPEQMKNHEIFNWINQLFGQKNSSRLNV